MSLNRIAAAATAGMLACAPSPLLAQGGSADTARTLPAVEVTSSVLPAAGMTAGPGATARVAVIDAAALRRLVPRHIAEALAALPGLSLYDDLGSAYKPTLVMRGFTASGVVGLPQGVSVFLDGVPVNEPDAGQVNFDLLPLQHATRVEVFSGTASLLGPNSLAGAVNLVTSRGGGPARGAIALGAGSHRRQSAAAVAEGDAGPFSYYTGAAFSRERGWRQRTSARLANVFANVGRFQETRGIGLQVSLASSVAETAGSLPQSVFGTRPDSNLSAGDFEDLRQLHVAVTGYTPAAGGRSSFTAYARAHAAERFNVNQVDDPDVRGFSENSSAGVQAGWSRTFALPGARASVRTGAGGSLHRTGIRLFGERIDPGLTTDVESPVRKADAYLLGDYERGRLTVAGGARVDVVQIPFHNRLRPARDTTSTFRHASPRLGISMALGRGVTAFASASRSFRAPAVIELACADPQEPCPLPFALGDDPPLAAVVATTVESGLRFVGGMWIIDASAYRTEVRDDIFLFPYHDEAEPAGSTIDGFFANIPRTRRQGLEVGARAVTSGAHELHLSYGLARATFRSEAAVFSIREAAGQENVAMPGDRLPLVPGHTAAAGALLRLFTGVSAGGEVRYTGQRWLRGDEANETAPLGGYAVADLRAELERDRWTLDAVVTNAFGSAHAAFGTYNINQGAGGILERFLTPAQRRAIQVTVRRRLGG